MRRPEPAEAIWIGLISVGVMASGLLIERGHRPLTAVAHDHPGVMAYLVGHFIGVWPKALDPISVGHGAYLRRSAWRRAGGTQAARAAWPAAR